MNNETLYGIPKETDKEECPEPECGSKDVLRTRLRISKNDYYFPKIEPAGKSKLKFYPIYVCEKCKKQFALKQELNS